MKTYIIFKQKRNQRKKKSIQPPAFLYGRSVPVEITHAATMSSTAIELSPRKMSAGRTDIVSKATTLRASPSMKKDIGKEEQVFKGICEGCKRDIYVDMDEDKKDKLNLVAFKCADEPQFVFHDEYCVVKFVYILCVLCVIYAHTA